MPARIMIVGHGEQTDLAAPSLRTLLRETSHPASRPIRHAFSPGEADVGPDRSLQSNFPPRASVLIGTLTLRSRWPRFRRWYDFPGGTTRRCEVRHRTRGGRIPGTWSFAENLLDAYLTPTTYAIHVPTATNGASTTAALSNAPTVGSREPRRSSRVSYPLSTHATANERGP